MESGYKVGFVRSALCCALLQVCCLCLLEMSVCEWTPESISFACVQCDNLTNPFISEKCVCVCLFVWDHTELSDMFIFNTGVCPRVSARVCFVVWNPIRCVKTLFGLLSAHRHTHKHNYHTFVCVCFLCAGLCVNGWLCMKKCSVRWCW